MNNILKINNFKTRLIDLDDKSSLQDLHNRCNDYSLIVNGKIPEDEAEKTLTGLPSAKSKDDKYVIGVFGEEAELVAALDLIKDYPEEKVWWIGLLMIDPDMRGHGLGRIIFNALKEWITQFNVEEIRLGVVERNEKAIKFWTKLGFSIIEKRPPVKFGLTEQSVIVMGYYL